MIFLFLRYSTIFVIWQQRPLPFRSFMTSNINSLLLQVSVVNVICAAMFNSAATALEGVDFLQVLNVGWWNTWAINVYCSYSPTLSCLCYCSRVDEDCNNAIKGWNTPCIWSAKLLSLLVAVVLHLNSAYSWIEICQMTLWSRFSETLRANEISMQSEVKKTRTTAESDALVWCVYANNIIVDTFVFNAPNVCRRQ